LRAALMTVAHRAGDAATEAFARNGDRSEP
jgi:hypothetical protein